MSAYRSFESLTDLIGSAALDDQAAEQLSPMTAMPQTTTHQDTSTRKATHDSR